MAPAIEVFDAVKIYPLTDRDVLAIDGLNLSVDVGDFVAITGRSGSGKSTLLNLLCGIDRTTSGTVCAAGVDLGTIPPTALAGWRSRNVGVVLQNFQLLPQLTVIENVTRSMAMPAAGTASGRLRRATQLLDRLAIAEQADQLPATLSWGQLRRVAIARALVNDPPLLLADEPTSNLDCATAQSVLNLFADLNDDGRTVVIISHEAEIRAVAKRRIVMADGRIVADERLAPVHP